MKEERQAVAGWDRIQDILISINGVNSLNGAHGSEKRIPVVKVRVKSIFNGKETFGWAYLSASKKCILVLIREKTNEGMAGSTVIPVYEWRHIFVFRENPYFEEIELLTEEISMFDFSGKQLIPAQNL